MTTQQPRINSLFPDGTNFDRDLPLEKLVADSSSTSSSKDQDALPAYDVGGDDSKSSLSPINYGGVPSTPNQSSNNNPQTPGYIHGSIQIRSGVTLDDYFRRVAQGVEFKPMTQKELDKEMLKYAHKTFFKTLGFGFFKSEVYFSVDKMYKLLLDIKLAEDELDAILFLNNVVGQEIYITDSSYYVTIDSVLDSKKEPSYRIKRRYAGIGLIR